MRIIRAKDYKDMSRKAANIIPRRSSSSRIPCSALPPASSPIGFI